MQQISDAVVRASALAERQNHVITLAQARACGLHQAAIRAFLRAGAWRRLDREVLLVDADLLGETPRRAELRAALLRHGPDAVLWGASAAEVHGIAGFATEQVWVMLPIGQERPQGRSIRLRFRAAEDIESWETDGLAVTPPHQTLADLVAIVDGSAGSASSTLLFTSRSSPTRD